MSNPFTMPALSPTMEKGNLARWVVAVGDQVKAGDVLAEVETDKATMEIEAVEDGVIDAILVPGGTEDVRVGMEIARISAPSATTLEAGYQIATAQPPKPPAAIPAEPAPPQRLTKRGQLRSQRQPR